MSQKKIIINNSKYKRNVPLSRSSEPFKKFQTKFDASKKLIYRSSITKLKPSNSYLLSENQSFYKYKYSLEDKADDTNIVFFDANSRKFRTRSSTKVQHPKTLIKSYNTISNINTDKNGKNNVNQGKSFSKIRNSTNNLYNYRNNNEKSGKTSNNISNKINLIKIKEKIIKNKDNRTQIIKLPKREKNELSAKSSLNRRNQLTKNIYNQDKNNSRNISNQKNINKNIPQNIPLLNNNNKRPETNTNYDYITKSFNKSQNSQLKNKPDYSTNNKLNSSNKKPEQKEQIDINKSNIMKKNNPLEEQNKNLNIETSEKKEERTLILVPGQTIEKRSVVENFENPIEEIIENPDGTFSSIIKQTKVTTITENIPIEENKIKALEGAPQLPVYKQQMTHIYKTITTVTKKPGIKNKNNININVQNENNITDIKNKSTNNNNNDNNFNNINNSNNTNNIIPVIKKSNNKNNMDNNMDNHIDNNMDNHIDNNMDNHIDNNIDNNMDNHIDNNMDNHIDKNMDKNIDKNIDKKNKINDNINSVNINKENINKNLNKNEKFDDINSQKENKIINEKNKYPINNMSSKDLKDAKKTDNIMGKNSKIPGDNINISPEEKEKNIKNILNSISLGNNSEENVEKLSKFLSNMDEKERKEFLEKLGKDQKYFNLIQKLKKSVENHFSKNLINNKSEEYNKNAKGLSSSKKFDSGIKSLYSENVEVKEINPLKFDGLFLEIDENNYDKKEKNPFEGPSPYIEFYKERSIKIKEKINRLSMNQVEQNEKKEN